MNKGAWIAILVSIPISLLTGLAVGPIERWYKRRIRRRDLELQKKDDEEQEQILGYIAEPAAFSQYLTHSAIELMWYLLFVLIGIGMLVLVMGITIQLKVGSVHLSLLDRIMFRIGVVFGGVALEGGIIMFLVTGRSVGRIWGRHSFATNAIREIRAKRAARD